MIRQTFMMCKVCTKVHEVSAWPMECFEFSEKKRSDLPMPYIRSDGMEPILNHANGLMYDSRSAYERAVKDAGCVIVGNDMPDVKEPAPISEREIEQDIKTAIEQVEATL